MLRRLIPATAAAALLLTGLTACSGQNGAAADCEPLLSPGVLSDAVVTFGDPGAAPQVSIPENASILTSQRTVVSGEEREASSNAKPIRGDNVVGLNIAAFDVTTGEMVYASEGFSNGAPEVLLVSEEQRNPMGDALICAAPGDRVVAALAPQDARLFAQQLGTSEDDPLVLVLDIVSAGPLHAEGRVRGLPSGFPAVVTNAEGRPGIVLPPREAPDGIRSASRIVGSGEKITAEDGIVGQLLEVKWDGSVSTNTWDTGVTGLGNEEQIAQSGYTFRTELTGKTVGSQVVIVDDNGGDPRVLVVDILAAV